MECGCFIRSVQEQDSSLFHVVVAFEHAGVVSGARGQAIYRDGVCYEVSKGCADAHASVCVWVELLHHGSHDLWVSVLVYGYADAV